MLSGTVSDLSKSNELSGLFKVLTTNELSIREVLDDMVTVLEGDGLEHIGDVDEKGPLPKENLEKSTNHSVDDTVIIDNILNNSKGVKDATDKSYRTMMKAHNKFLQENGLIKPLDNIYESKPTEKTPYYVAAYIMHK
ncbi:hypothetical protein EDD18DRAFT_1354905 [Armillaria luteobubalina]|uniref:Uncharacterized protein n=1 Tax=Armillaria luteobubalina TaxID=153913 RepID=A0AA39Q296_9AGAR|nr:hypothetical protein EDD18DRAFT_1354905 [Armillaria luteobubalina]